MALIVEDGSLVVGATSYVTLSYIRTWCANRGKVLSAVDETLEQEVIMAMDKIESFRSEFKGSKVTTTQALQWPRYGVYIDNSPILHTTIPVELKTACAQLVWDIEDGLQLNTVSEDDFRRKSKVEIADAISVEFERGSGSPVGSLTSPKFDAIFKTLLNNGGISDICGSRMRC